MPSKPRPKKFVAATNLHGEYAKGDPVTGARLVQLLAFGDKFVTEDVPARKGTKTTDVDAVDDTKEN